MKTELIVTIALAVGGWGWAFYQFIVNRRWQKNDKLSDRRFEAYNNFMKKLDIVNESMRMNPNFIFGEIGSLFKVIFSDSSEDINTALENYLQSQMDMVKEATKPLLIINQEINELTLIASEELWGKLLVMKKLVEDLYNEMLNCLSMVNVKNQNSFEALETIGYDNRMLEYNELYDEIIKLMRKEINVK